MRPAAAWTEIASLAVPLPLDALRPAGEAPPRVSGLTATRGGRAVRTSQASTGSRLLVMASSRDLRHGDGPLQVSFTSASLLFLVGGDGALQTWRLGFSIELPPASRVIVNLEHSPELSLRCRVDSSEYHSLAQGVAQGTVRKIGFYPSGRADMTYLFGLHSESRFRSLAMLPFAGSVGLLATGLTIALMYAGYTDMAAVALALALAPPALQAARPSTGFYRSADIHSRGPAVWIFALSMAAYVPTTLFAILTLTDLSHLRRLSQSLCYSLGVLLGLFGIGILVAVREQVLPAHYCDVCTHRLFWRRRSRLHWASRRTVCQGCFADIEAREQAEG
ncbi:MULTISPECIES: hypothetical protein [Micromonospora]|uniref:hypothetical protein n=1 Tax=Micromonospora TaxID=1873 RepID=UPI001319D144|nr:MULTISPECIES: hypothetical protein [Micromonospora]NES16565.1 hypothetical protein [Micromonospora sp. PPF5-17B]NES37609.1 hypothetical protein [Micromonospora solifontis]NES58511.1 hypothetical protein [Micromonospora sp. PPF5-6]